MSENEKIFKSIILGDSEIIEKVYSNSFPSIRKLVLNNSGSKEDAEDVFQEALIVLYRKIKDNQLVLNCELSTFIYSICYKMWLDKLRRKKNVYSSINHNHKLVDLDEDTQMKINMSERFRLYQECFNMLGNDCKKLLKLFFQKKNMNEIAQVMGYGSESYARKRKFKCKEKLIKNIVSDPRFNELKEGNIFM